MVYNELWALAEGASIFTDLVKPSNRIKFSATKPSDPVKREVSTADLPEVVLISTGMSAALHSTSSSTMCVRQYEWIIATGDLSLVNKLMPVEWAVFVAMSGWKAVLTALQWNGAGFVKRCDLGAIDNGFTDPERNRGIRGWSAIWRCEVEMHFRTQDLINAREP